MPLELPLLLLHRHGIRPRGPASVVSACQALSGVQLRCLMSNGGGHGFEKKSSGPNVSVCMGQPREVLAQAVNNF